MRRILIPASLLALTLSVFVSVRAADNKPAAKTGAKAAATATAYGNSDSITTDELKIYLYFLASDQLEGRNLPSRGFDVAALYVASHLAEWGLKPLGSTTDTNGPLQPYFMPMELVARQVNAEESKATVTAPAGRGGGRGGQGGAGGGARGGAPAGPAQLTYGKDWTVPAGGRGAPPVAALDVTGNLVFAGNGYVINKGNLNPYQGLDVKGKIIVVAGVPPSWRPNRLAGAAADAVAAGTPPMPHRTLLTEPSQLPRAAVEAAAVPVPTRWARNARTS